MQFFGKTNMTNTLLFQVHPLAVIISSTETIFRLVDSNELSRWREIGRDA